MPVRDVLVRRARCLVAFWESSDFRIENYISGKATFIAPLVSHVLQQLSDYMPLHEVLSEFQSIPGSDEIVNQLIHQDILVERGSQLDEMEREIDQNWAWSHEARYFHYSTRRVNFEEDPVEQRASLVRLAKKVSPPSPFKDYGKSDVPLDGSFTNGRDAFWEVLRARRTGREFGEREISFSDFSWILLWTWGSTKISNDPDLGSFISKTSPSGGARHPIEVYPVVLSVEDVEPGIYHYSVIRHELESLKLGNFQDLVTRACVGALGMRKAAAVFFMTAVLPRSMWKYKHGHAYRVVHLDAGHLGQTFHLVCTRLGLVPFTAAAVDHGEIENELGIDGVREISLYVAATGSAPPNSS